MITFYIFNHWSDWRLSAY